MLKHVVRIISSLSYNWGQGELVRPYQGCHVTERWHRRSSGSSGHSPGCKMQNAILFTQDHLCMMKSHILWEVTLLWRTQWI